MKQLLLEASSKEDLLSNIAKDPVKLVNLVTGDWEYDALEVRDTLELSKIVTSLSWLLPFSEDALQGLLQSLRTVDITSADEMLIGSIDSIWHSVDAYHSHLSEEYESVKEALGKTKEMRQTRKAELESLIHNITQQYEELDAADTEVKELNAQIQAQKQLEQKLSEATVEAAKEGRNKQALEEEIQELEANIAEQEILRKNYLVEIETYYKKQQSTIKEFNRIRDGLALVEKQLTSAMLTRDEEFGLLEKIIKLNEEASMLRQSRNGKERQLNL